MASPPNAGAAVFLQTGGEAFSSRRQSIADHGGQQAGPVEQWLCRILARILDLREVEDKAPIHNPGGN
jgi:hypothetical protein